MSARTAARLEYALGSAQQALGHGMYRLEFPWRYHWLRLTFRKDQIRREQQEFSDWLVALYTSGAPMPETPRWMR